MSHDDPPIEHDGSCCYEARLVAGFGGHNPAHISKRAAAAFKFLKWWPAKLALSAQYVEVRRVETGQTATYGFIGFGLGAGLSVAVEVKNWSPIVCCPNDCPTFADFTGFGRLTILEAALIGGMNVAYLDFGSPKGCRLYFENVIGLILGVGVEIGTFLGYYFRVR